LAILLVPGSVMAGQFVIGSGFTSSVEFPLVSHPGVVLESGYDFGQRGGLGLFLPLSISGAVGWGGGDDTWPLPWLTAELRYRWYLGGTAADPGVFASVGAGAGGYPLIPLILVLPAVEIGSAVAHVNWFAWEVSLRDRVSYFSEHANLRIRGEQTSGVVNTIELVSSFRFGK
jgi:hypothetical protein